jgi:hypothetical protein
MFKQIHASKGCKLQRYDNLDSCGEGDSNAQRMLQNANQRIAAGAIADPEPKVQKGHDDTPSTRLPALKSTSRLDFERRAVYDAEAITGRVRITKMCS